jgi:hypothetical protein
VPEQGETAALGFDPLGRLSNFLTHKVTHKVTHMAVRTYTIEIRTDHETSSKDEMVKEMVRIAAKGLLTSAMLLQDRRAPQIAVESGDMFEQSKEIMLVDTPVDEEIASGGAPSEGAHSSNANTARVAGYTVSDKGQGWKFNDPDGKWSDQAYTTEAQAWEAAFADITATARVS